MKHVRYILLVLVLIPLLSISQSADCQLHKDSVKARLYHIVEVLSHDSLKGREAGTEDEYKAAIFIKNKFSEIGLKSIFKDSSYLQMFEFVDGISLPENNFLKINNKSYKLLDDYYPLNISGSSTVSGEIIRVGYGVRSPENFYDDYEFYLNDTYDKELKEKIFAIELGIPASLKGKENISVLGDIEVKVKLAIEKGAKAVIFIMSDKNLIKPYLDRTRFEQPLSIPVIFADQQAYKTIMDSNSAIAELSVNLEKGVKKAYNVIGFLDNKAAKTIVIGSHFDHLGMGGGISRHKGAPAVHHGADDNASGVSAMIEIARNLKCNGFTKFNVIFIAFSAEEKGLLGSSYFTKNKTYPLEKINYMLNLDMIGRIDSIAGKLSIIGTGSSPAWNAIIDKTTSESFEIVKSEMNVGGSDQATFYTNEIPILFFFSGLHDDYHKPGDVIDKINFNGIFNTVQYASSLINNTTSYDKLPYSKLTNSTTRERKKPSVTLGITPDHAFEGVGLRVADVTENQAAAKSGIIKGDLILKINEYEIRDIYSYMNALSKFTNGDKITLTISRISKKMDINVVL